MNGDGAVADSSGSRRPGLSWPALVAALLVALCALLLAGWGLGELARSYTQSADLDAVRSVAAHRTGALIILAHILSRVGSGYVVFPLAAIIAVALCWRRIVHAALAVAVAVGGATLISTVDKALVGRPRPPVHHLEHVTSGSFPSGHAMQASSFYGSLLIIYLWRSHASSRVVLVAAATVALIVGIALSRVYLGVHYPSDIAGGLLLGSSWSAIAAGLLRRGASRA